MSYLSGNPSCSLKSHEEMTKLKPLDTVFTPFSNVFLTDETIDILNNGLLLIDPKTGEDKRFPLFDGDFLHNNIKAIGLFDSGHDFNKPDNNRCIDRSTKLGNDVFLNKFTFSFLRQHAYDLEFQVSEYLSNYDINPSILPAQILENYFALGQMFEIVKTTDKEMYICPNMHDYMKEVVESGKLSYHPTTEGAQLLLNNIITIFASKGWVDIKQQGLFIVTDTQKNLYKIIKTTQNTGINMTDNSVISIKLLLMQENINDPANVSNIDTAYDRFGNEDERIFIEKPGQTRKYFAKTNQAIQGKYDCRFDGMKVTNPTDLLNSKIQTTIQVLGKNNEPIETLTDITMNENPHRNNITSLSYEIEKEEKKNPTEIPILKMTDEYNTYKDRQIYESDTLQNKINANFGDLDVTDEMAKIDFYIRNFSRKRWGDVLQGECCNEINKGSEIDFCSVTKTSPIVDNEPTIIFKLNELSNIKPSTAILVTIDRMLFAYAVKKRIPCILDTEQHMIIFAPQNIYAKQVTEEEYNILSEEERYGLSFTDFIANPENPNYKLIISTIRKKQGELESQNRRELSANLLEEARLKEEQEKETFNNYPPYIKELYHQRDNAIIIRNKISKDIVSKERTLEKLHKDKDKEVNLLTELSNKDGIKPASIQSASTSIENKHKSIQKSVDSIEEMRKYLTEEVNVKLELLEEFIKNGIVDPTQQSPVLITPFKEFIASRKPATSKKSASVNATSTTQDLAKLALADIKRAEKEAKKAEEEAKKEAKKAIVKPTLKKPTKKGTKITGGATSDEIANFIFTNPGFFFTILPFFKNISRHKKYFTNSLFIDLYNNLEFTLLSDDNNLNRYISDSYLLHSNNENVKMYYIANEEKINELLKEDERFIKESNFETVPRTFIAIFNDNDEMLLEVIHSIENGEQVKQVRLFQTTGKYYFFNITLLDIKELIGNKSTPLIRDDVRGGARRLSNVIDMFLTFFNSRLRTDITINEVKLRNINIINTIFELLGQYEFSLLLNTDTASMVYNETITSYQIPHNRFIYLFLNNIVNTFNDTNAKNIHYHFLEAFFNENKTQTPLFEQFQDIKLRILEDRYYVFHKKEEIPRATREFFNKIVEKTIQDDLRVDREYSQFTKEDNRFKVFGLMNEYHLRNHGFIDIGFEFFNKTLTMKPRLQIEPTNVLPSIPSSYKQVMPPETNKDNFMPIIGQPYGVPVGVGGSTRKRRVTKRRKNKKNITKKGFHKKTRKHK